MRRHTQRSHTLENSMLHDRLLCMYTYSPCIVCHIIRHISHISDGVSNYLSNTPSYIHVSYIYIAHHMSFDVCFMYHTSYTSHHGAYHTFYIVRHTLALVNKLASPGLPTPQGAPCLHRPPRARTAMSGSGFSVLVARTANFDVLKFC
jgi:hypothetical protein